MIINASVGIAFKEKNGEYFKVKKSLFELCGLIQEDHSSYLISRKNKDIIFKINCPICGEKHQYTYRMQDIISKELLVGGCEITGMPVFYIGKEEKLKNIIHKQKEVFANMHFMI